VDHYLPDNERFPGGISANFARHARRVFAPDDRIHLISASGDDAEAATLAQSAVAAAGVRCHFTDLPGRTPVQYIEVQPNGERCFLRYEEGVLGGFRMHRRHLDLAADADVLVTPVFQQIVALFESVLAMPVKGKRAVDFADFAEHPDFAGVTSWLKQIDVAFFGLEPEQQDLIQRLETLARESGRLLLVTLGGAGSVAFRGDEVCHMQAIRVADVRDTTGAGDAYAAGFLSQFLHGADLATAMEKGARLAAQTIQRIGAVPP
jgi:sugar/nucleoside kinase (ribokinase family)